MGIAEAVKEVAKFLNNIFERFPKREKSRKPVKALPPVRVVEAMASDKLRALRALAEDIKWLPLQEDLPPRETNICWALQLTFQRIRYSRDAAEIAEILRDMRKLSFEKALKRTHSDCLGLPTMLDAVCCCCSDLYDDRKEEIKNLSAERFRQIASNAVEVCRNLLLPYMKREKDESLFPDAAIAIGNSIEMFSKTLSTYSTKWSEDLHDQLMGTVDSVVSVLKEKDLSEKEIRGKLKGFANQIPPAFSTLAKEHPEKWLPTLRFLCSTGAPRSSHGPLCKLWRRLTVVSRSEGFAFLRKLIEGTFDSVWTQLDLQTSPANEDSGVAQDIAGCIHGLIEQCCRSSGPRLGFYWHSQIHPAVVGYMMKRQEQLGRASGPVHEYLGKIISMINKFPKVSKKPKPSTTRVKEIRPTVPRPDDSLSGLIKKFY